MYLPSEHLRASLQDMTKLLIKLSSKHWFLAVICFPASIDGTQNYVIEEKNWYV